jgi:OmcA/MtrC family decaheme c-type cytochrome
MALLQCGIVLTAAASVLVPAHRPVAQSTPGTRLERTRPPVTYTVHQVESYLSAQQVQYIRPGFKISIQSLTIPQDRRPVVEMTFTDDMGQPLDRAGKVTPGALSISFVLARYDGQEREFYAYTRRNQRSPITGVTASQGSADSGGNWEDLALGRARYRFGTALPADYPASMTHTLGIYATRNLMSIIEKNYFANVVHDFVPAGGAVVEKWDAIADATCNSCHDQLAFHGGSRRDVKLCMTCHESATVDPDTGNSVDMKVMIHKIHRGKDLPSVVGGTPYVIIGHNQTPHDYSHIGMPQDLRNCTTCHRPSATEGHVWMTEPSRDACGSCHDDVNWVTGENHAAGPQLSDAGCASCHRPEGEMEFDASVKGAHTIPAKSAQLKGLNIEILDVTNAVPGGKPEITFRVTDGDGAFIDPTTLNSLNFLLGGPSTEYTT